MFRPSLYKEDWRTVRRGARFKETLGQKRLDLGVNLFELQRLKAVERFERRL